MKRLTSLLLIVILLCACRAGSGSNDPKEYGADYAQRVADAWRAAGYLDDMAADSDTDLLDSYGIDLSVCRCGKGFADAVGYTKEAVVTVADEATAKEIETLLSDHIEAMKNAFRTYDPEAYRIAENAVLLRDGGMVVMIISPDAQAMLETLRSVTP